jgi:aminoglycoside phosphotransferase (APT) family kinase protein
MAYVAGESYEPQLSPTPTRASPADIAARAFAAARMAAALHAVPADDLRHMQCSGPSIDAVIDWEIWSLGDRRLDLTWPQLLVDPAHPSRVRAATGLPAPADLVAAYEAAAGQLVADLGWFNALVRYKQAAASALIIKNNRKLPQPGIDIERMLAGLPLLLDWAEDLPA